MASVSKIIDDQYGGLPKFAERVWQNLDSSVAHGKGDDVLWGEIRKVCQDLLGDDQGEAASVLLKDKGFFSIVFPD